MLVHISLQDGVPDFRTPRDLEVGYLVNQRALTDVFRFAQTSHKWSIALPTKGLHRSPPSVKIS
jgi:hypothetical protein